VRVVLSQEEVAQLLEAAPGVKYKAAFSVAYGAGLRVSELPNLKVSDIDSKRMLLRIEQGKGKRDRYAMLSPRLQIGRSSASSFDNCILSLPAQIAAGQLKRHTEAYLPPSR
jgi:integrase